MMGIVTYQALIKYAVQSFTLCCSIKHRVRRNFCKPNNGTAKKGKSRLDIVWSFLSFSNKTTHFQLIVTIDCEKLYKRLSKRNSVKERRASLMAKAQEIGWHVSPSKGSSKEKNRHTTCSGNPVVASRRRQRE